MNGNAQQLLEIRHFFTKNRHDAIYIAKHTATAVN